MIIPLTAALQTSFGPYLETPLDFNHAAIQRYPHDSFGIGRHRDESRNRNLIVLLPLDGQGNFAIYQDLKEESTAIAEVVLQPGGILLMVAPGFRPTDGLRPVHEVKKIIGGKDGYRYLLGLRQHQ